MPRTVLAALAWCLCAAPARADHPPAPTLDPVSGPQLSRWLAYAEASAAGPTVGDAAVKVSQGTFGGSGVMVGRADDGTVVVLSAAHVFRQTGPARVVTAGGQSFAATVHDLDRKTDVALLSAPIPWDVAVVCTPVADACPGPGADTLKVGFPAYAGGKADVRWGKVLSPRSGFLFNASLYVRSGDSGGPVFSGDGKLISIVSGYTGGDVLWGSGTSALHAMVEKHGWACCIFGKRPPKPQKPGKPGGPAKPLPRPPPDPEILPPPNPRPDVGAILIEIELLRKEVAALKGVPGPKGDKGEPGAKGDAGPAGPAGLPGKDADAARLAELEAELEKLRRTKFIAELLNEKGEVKQRVEFGPTQPLRLKLVPVQPAKP